LYRLFGDKNGLFSAVVDRAFRRFLNSKRAQESSDDQVADLYVACAPTLKVVPAGVTEARLLLLERIVRCAEVGRLSIPSQEAPRS
jgi:AcrR family transcriptional regulator